MSRLINLMALLVFLLPGPALAVYQYHSQFGVFGTSDGQFDSPRGVAIIDGTGIVVTESGNNRYQVCTETGICHAEGMFGTESGQFDRPRGVTVNSVNRIFIADRGNDRIQNCNEFGSCTTFGGSGSQVGQFESPRGIVAISGNRLAITDTDNNRIQLCTELGSCTAFGSTGAATGQFISPAGIAVNSLGQLIIADRGNDRIQICSEAGSCTAFGSFGTGPGQFDTPAGVAVDSQDRIIVADRFNNRVQICTSAGSCETLGSFGSGDGQFNLPWGIAVDDQDRIVVADLGNNRIQIFSEGAAVVINSLTASPNPIEQGQSVLISWSVSNATSCTPLGGAGNWTSQFINASGGSVNIQIDTAGDYLFTIQCSNGSGSVSRSVSVQVTAPSFLINPGLNDAWVSADAEKQGFFFTVFESLNLMFISWFTFDSVVPDDGTTAVFGSTDHRWVTGLGSYSGNTVNITVELTSGGVFNAADPLAGQDPSYGTITIVFTNCSEAILNYNFPGPGLSGQMTLNRVLESNVPVCEALAAQ